jgi:hypothetical protein
MSVALVGALLCGCQSPQHSASPATTSQSAAPVVNAQPLPVRPVKNSQPTTPDTCPATNPNAPTAPTDFLTTCDIAKKYLYTAKTSQEADQLFQLAGRPA